jgi:membrane fusion protein, multidrug efflux system
VKSWMGKFLLGIVLAALLGGGYWMWHSRGRNPEPPAKEAAEAEAKPVAGVKTAPIQKGSLATNIVVYGTVIPAPGSVQTLTALFECRVLQVLVSEGQKVLPGEALVEIEPSLETSLQTEQARNTFKLTQESLQHVQQQFDLKFAGNEQLLQAKQAFQDAKLKLESLQRRGIDGKRKLQAKNEGLITKVTAEPGALIAAGNSLAEFVAPDEIEIKLGFEIEDLKRIHQGQSISLRQVGTLEGTTVTGKIRAISQAINPNTRLVDVFVSLPPKTKFFLDGFIQGTAQVATVPGLIVPRTAVLPEEDHYVLYTVKKEHAVKHIVQIDMENDKSAVVIGKDLSPGDPVVVLGNYELEDGMAVKEGIVR